MTDRFPLSTSHVQPFASFNIKTGSHGVQLATRADPAKCGYAAMQRSTAKPRHPSPVTLFTGTSAPGISISFSDQMFYSPCKGWHPGKYCCRRARNEVPLSKMIRLRCLCKPHELVGTASLQCRPCTGSRGLQRYPPDTAGSQAARNPTLSSLTGLPDDAEWLMCLTTAAFASAGNVSCCWLHPQRRNL